MIEITKADWKLFHRRKELKDTDLASMQKVLFVCHGNIRTFLRKA